MLCSCITNITTCQLQHEWHFNECPIILALSHILNKEERVISLKS